MHCCLSSVTLVYRPSFYFTSIALNGPPLRVLHGPISTSKCSRQSLYENYDFDAEYIPPKQSMSSPITTSVGGTSITSSSTLIRSKFGRQDDYIVHLEAAWVSNFKYSNQSCVPMPGLHRKSQSRDGARNGHQSST